MMEALSVANGSLVQTLDTLARMAAHRHFDNTDSILQILDEVIAHGAAVVESASGTRH